MSGRILYDCLVSCTVTAAAAEWPLPLLVRPPGTSLRPEQTPVELIKYRLKLHEERERGKADKESQREKERREDRERETDRGRDRDREREHSILKKKKNIDKRVNKIGSQSKDKCFRAGINTP